MADCTAPCEELIRLQERLAAEITARQLAREISERDAKILAELLVEYKAQSNEWRGAMQDRESRFVQVTAAEASEAKIMALLGAIDKRLEIVEKVHIAEGGSRNALRNAWVIAASIIGTAAVIVTLIMKFVNPG